jgi:plasmid stabilization system protein ParE
MLLSQPGMGRIGRVAGTREWIISGTPYFLVYVVHDEILQVLRLIHGKQDWPVIAHSKKS